MCTPDKSPCSVFILVLFLWPRQPGFTQCEFMMWYPGSGRLSMAVTGLAGEITVSQALGFVLRFGQAWPRSSVTFPSGGVWTRQCLAVERSRHREQTVTQIHTLSFSFCERREWTSWVAALKTLVSFPTDEEACGCVCVCVCRGFLCGQPWIG